ncbi:MAG: hypothetical protein CL608_15185 [Anaerolineaceae bacterium]|nr:hypothetical protein [Anaerolineaceae bacterium]
MSGYFNFGLHTAVSPWERRTFLEYSRRIFGRDPRWVPFDAHKIHHAIDPALNPHLARLNPSLFYFDGLRRQDQPLAGPGLTMFETPLVTAILLQDPRRQDRTAYLAHLHCANSTKAFLAFQDNLIEELAKRGIRRLIGPTGLSPHLGSGALASHWQQWPPQHTPYNPPYLPEILDRRMQPFAQSVLFHFVVPRERPSPPQTPATLQPLNPAQLNDELLPLLAAACQNPAGFAPPDPLEAEFWQRWLGPQLHGWVAQVDGTPVGLVLLLPDLADRLRRFRGGRGLWRLGLTAVKNRHVQAGRVLLGGVLPQWRNQGIGQQLWQQTIRTAQHAGWQRLTIGPVWQEETAVSWLQKQNASPQQTYQLYERTF